MSVGLCEWCDVWYVCLCVMWCLFMSCVCDCEVCVCGVCVVWCVCGVCLL